MAKTQALTTEQILRLAAVVDIATAGAAFGVGKSKAYQMAKQGIFPCRVLRLGSSYRVAKTAICAELGIEVPQPASTPAAEDSAA